MKKSTENLADTFQKVGLGFLLGAFFRAETGIGAFLLASGGIAFVTGSYLLNRLGD